MIPRVRRIYIHISLDVFEMDWFPGKMQAELYKKKVLFLFLEYKVKDDDISW